MSTPNPLIPQGSLLEQQATNKSTFQVAAFIVALHVVILGGLLFLGCKKEERQGGMTSTDGLISPPPADLADRSLPADPFAVSSDAEPSYDNTPYSPPPVTTTPQVTVVPSVPLELPPYTPPAAPAVPLGGGSEHVVQKGDVAYNIARARGVTLKQLQEANPGVDLARIRVNQKLWIPAASAPGGATGSAGLSAGDASGWTGEVYVVRGGDNLSRIARKFNVTVKEIREANGLKSNDIKIAQKLRIPPSSGPAPGAVPPR
ncbi:MAG: LysM peptidoglycan-binding domain-containing protein [Verrucomicrobiae bacterium]|nr:LysM peptidoglycan-binding domain-containing protein [Verrucomicrobiae bacterium]